MTLDDEDLEVIGAIVAAKVSEALAARAKKRPSAFVDAAELIRCGVEPRHATEWLAIRKAKNSPLTLTAWELTQAEAVKANKPISEAIKTSCAHGWAGFRASWLAKMQEEAPEKGSTDDALKRLQAHQAEMRRRQENQQPQGPRKAPEHIGNVLPIKRTA